ncbi:probable RNA-binding protein 46 [Bacillus rossius redtenbacheri]|uniref:probable RNA-binding protein 46 n=1 Tax=Bacillus rossius redtenbacheri TaxID=93214 RepID=UPI002FDDA45D
MDAEGHASSTLLELMRRTGYAFQQKNGQRIFGPPSTWTAGPPPRGCEVFVAKLPRYLFEDELFPLFSRAGTVYQMRLMVDFSGSNRGFGFVQFSRPEEARAAIALLDNHEVRPGRFIGVIRSIDNRRVYVGNLPKEMSKAQLADFFRGEVEGVVDVIVYQSVVKKPLNRGFVFLEFATHTDAAIARRKLKLICMEPGKQMIVDWAIPLPEVPDHVMREVRPVAVAPDRIAAFETCS